MQSNNHTSFALTDNLKIRCTLVLSSSGLSLLSALLVYYIYFRHFTYKVHLRSQFNNLIVGSILLEAVQSVQRIIAASALLTGTMDPGLCNTLGGFEIFFNMASMVLIIGFYYSLLALRYNPLRWLIVQLITSSTFESVRKYIWYAVAAVLSTVVTIIGFLMLHHERPKGTLFGASYGFCTIPRNSDPGSDSAYNRLIFLDIAAPTMILLLVGIGSFIALRVRVSAISGLSFRQAFPLYVRFFTIIVYIIVVNSINSVAVLAENDITTATTAVSITVPLYGFVLSMSFLVSEGLLLHALRLLFCGVYDDDNSPTTSQQNLTTDTANIGDVGVEDGASSAMDTHRSTLHKMSRRSSAISQRSVKKSLNGFTSCIQSILVLEVQGVHFVVTNQDLLLAEQDSLLAPRNRGATPVPRAAVDSPPSRSQGSPGEHTKSNASTPNIVYGSLR